LGIAVVASWWVFLKGDGVAEAKPKMTLAAVSTRPPEAVEAAPLPPSTPVARPESEKPAEVPETKPAPPPPAPTADATSRIRTLVEGGKQALAANNPLSARTNFNQALALVPAEPERTVVRRELAKLGDEMIFSPRVYENDRLVARYVLQTGDTLAKVAVEHKVTADLLAFINGIADKNLIRAGQTIKVIEGPFHAKVDKKTYTLDVLLGETLVRQFSVGLGADDSTPNGTWKISSKLSNPTYHPPRGGAILAADDPKNPLGERWMGMVGVEGKSVGQERYGIHGTIEPESIGTPSSMGCIRLKNEDVEFLYNCLVEKHSLVVVE